LVFILQSKFNLPLGIVHREAKLEYFDTLERSREKDSIEPFNEFMEFQYNKQLINEIEKYKNQIIKKDKGMGMSFLF
jgi:hypothetical protein